MRWFLCWYLNSLISSSSSLMLSFLVVVCLTMPLERLFQCQNIYVYFRIQVVSRESRTMIRSSALSLRFLNQSTYSLARFLWTIVRTQGISFPNKTGVMYPVAIASTPVFWKKTGYHTKVYIGGNLPNRLGLLDSMVGTRSQTGSRQPPAASHRRAGNAHIMLSNHTLRITDFTLRILDRHQVSWRADQLQVLAKLCEFNSSTRDTFKETKPKPSGVDCFKLGSILRSKLNVRETKTRRAWR